MLIVVTGKICAGKSSIAKFIANKLLPSFTYTSFDEIIAEAFAKKIDYIIF